MDLLKAVLVFVDCDFCISLASSFSLHWTLNLKVCYFFSWEKDRLLIVLVFNTFNFLRASLSPMTKSIFTMKSILQFNLFSL